MASYHYSCLVHRQRPEVNDTPTFCLFHAPAGEILEWAVVKRLEEEAGAPQRRTSPAKVGAISNFLKTDQRNTIPTSVILTLDLPGYEVRPLNPENQESEYIGILEFEIHEEGQKPGLVIDGQHRLFGTQSFEPTLNVNVVALLNADDTEKAFQFMVINNKVSKVSTDHIRALALHYEKQQLDDRLKTARLALDPNVGFVGMVDSEDDSPFYRIISWPTNPKEQRTVPPSAIETSINYIQQQRVRQLESNDVLLEFFYAIWRTIKKQWGLIWNKESKLLNKVGIFCLTQYMTDALVASYDWGRLDISDPEQVIEHVEALLSHQEPKFWEVPWKPSSYDTKSGHALIVESLVRISRNLRANDPWYADLKIVDMTQLETTDKNIG